MDDVLWGALGFMLGALAQIARMAWTSGKG